MRRLLLPLVLLAAAANAALAAPAVFWTGDPVRPGETALLIGDQLPAKPSVEVFRLPDGPATAPAAAKAPVRGRRVEALQPGERALKFVLPADLAPGVFGYRVVGPGGAVTGFLNRPALWWAQGDAGASASPGGWVRVFGKNLSLPGGTPAAGQRRRADGAKGRPVLIRLCGPRTLLLPATADRYSARAALPANLPPGEYAACLHNGCGGSAAWSDPVRIAVARPKPWPARVYSVRDFGADGSGARDDTAAIQSALAKAGAAGGGILYFPRGRYQVTAMLTVPRFTVLRGEGRELVSLFWPDLPNPPEALVRGTNSFGIENLTLFAGNHVHVIAADQDTPDAGDVFVRRVRVRANAYMGHLKPEEVSERLTASLKHSTGGGDSLRLGGRNVEVSDCDIDGSGRAIYLSRVHGGRVTNNTFCNGRWGWYCLSGSDGLIFENNRIVGGDLMSTGGGINCLDGSPCSQNVYYAHNTLARMNGWDREAMTSDAGGGCYLGGVTSAEGKRVLLAEEPDTGGRSWAGAALFILDGRGRGQYRRVTGIQGRTVSVESPWAVPPDASSTVTLTMLQRHYLFVGNSFSDAGVAIQLYGMAVEHIADGNVSARTAGFHNFGMNYHGIQPSWYIQWLGNTIREGNSYRSGHDNHLLSGEAHLGVFALPPSVEFDHPLTLGCVVRGNRLESNAHLAVGGSDPYNPAYAHPTVQEVVVEQNRVTNSDVGIFLRRASSGVLLRDNTFERVREPVRDEVVQLKAAEERRRRLLAGGNPLAVWDFEGMTATGVPDGSGNGFAASPSGPIAPAEGRLGRGARFSGEGYLRLDEPMMFNLQSLTLSLWIYPDTVKGRHGLIAKRASGTVAPYILSLWDGGLEFEATDTAGKWSFNFRSPAVVPEGAWSYIAAVAEQGRGVTLYVNGKPVARKETPQERVANYEPLLIGREAWDGANREHVPCFFQGVMDELRIWPRALTEEEIAAEYRRGGGTP